MRGDRFIFACLIILSVLLLWAAIGASSSRVSSDSEGWVSPASNIEEAHVWPLHASVPLTTPTPIRTSTSTPFATATPGCCQDGVTGSGSVYCVGRQAWFTYGITNNCTFTVMASGTYTLETAPNPYAGWTPRRTVTVVNTSFGHGYTESSQVVWEGQLPNWNHYWRVRFSLRDTQGCWLIDFLTPIRFECESASPTPTRTPTQSTATPTSTRTATATATCISVGTPGPWAFRANYPEPMFGLAVASDGTSVYGFAGRNVSRQYTAYKYNYATDSWTRIADVPNASGTGSKADYGHNGKIYVTGGSVAQSANRIYDIAANSWTLGAPIPAEVSEHGHAYWNGKVYVIGGGPHGTPGSAVYSYNIATDTWSTLAPLPQAEYGMASAAINGKIYVANGYTSSGVTNTLYIYDISSNTWSQGAPSPLASYRAVGTAIGGKLYMIGGQTANGVTTTTYLYDPTTNIWSVGPSLNEPRGWSDGATINTPGGETAIVVGGDIQNASVEASTAPLMPCATMTGTPTAGVPSATRTPTAGVTTTVVPSSTALVPTFTTLPSNTAPATSTRTSTNTPTSTSVVSTPSATATNPAVSSPTSTVCAVTFRDVPQNHTFYPHVRCLACRGVVSGYVDGTFKPDNLVTRGQLAKIVSNAAGLTQEPGPQIYNDVPSSNPFYAWINSLTQAGHMSGYVCGAPGEPCPGSYFRPYANATRAQTSKIVSNAARYNEPPAGQNFEDVPTSHPFYEWIQRLASSGVMGGYECGGIDEPCIPPTNKPYFRPYNDVTRGQSAKIVAQAFFPGCVPFQ